MAINLIGSDPITQVMRLAHDRQLLPTALGSAAIQEMTQRLKERIFFSARTANLIYLDGLKKLVDRYVKGEGRNSDLARLRIEARWLLAQLGYDPETGFPGDAELGIPPATAGSLQDLGSERRLNLVFDTQAQLMRGLGLKLRGIQRVELWPAWELVRVAKFSSEHQREWLKRWKTAADEIAWEGVSKEAFAKGKMVALKTSAIWAALGSSALFADALNTDHPPFAFHSGMGWREVPVDEARKLGLVGDAVEMTGTPMTTEAALQEFVFRGFMPVDEWTKKPKIGQQPAQPAADAARAAKIRKLKAKFDALKAAGR